MWVFKGIVFLLLLIVLVYFFVTNSGQSVDINFFGNAYLGISIYWVVVISFLLGFGTSFTLAAFREFRFHREIGKLKRLGTAKDREISDLRTLPLKSMGSGDQESFKPGEQSGD
ncbi:MAG: LapA family protein [Candidatus Krumholzibacteria bacterium]|nr:LapA family protein [Candidatus Krumholzibacteria bacterium]